MVWDQQFPDASLDRSPERTRSSRLFILLGTWESRRTSKVGVMRPNSERGAERDLKGA